MDTTEILVSAEKSESEPWRLKRLDQIIGYVAALPHGMRALAKIEKLRDCRGVLAVTWLKPPTLQQRAMFKAAWRSGIGDGADSVEHVMGMP